MSSSKCMGDNIMKSYILLLCTVSTVHAQLSIIHTAPRNTAASTGSTVTIFCKWEIKYLASVKWVHYNNPAAPSTPVQITVDKTVSLNSGKYGVTGNTAGEYNLQVKSFQASDVGEYACITELQSFKYGLYLMKIDTPKLSVRYQRTELFDNIQISEGDTFALICKVQFLIKINSGRNAPILTWYSYTNEEVPVFDLSSGGTAHIEATIYNAKAEMNNKQFRCDTKFDGSTRWIIRPNSSTHVYASNSPDNIPPTYITIHVQYGPKDFTLKNVKESYIPGDEITAVASGNPEPQFLWTRSEGVGPLTASGPRFIITACMEGFNVYWCNASNTLYNGKVKNVGRNITFYVKRILATTPTEETTKDKTTTFCDPVPRETSGLFDGRWLALGMVPGTVLGLIIAAIVHVVLFKLQKITWKQRESIYEQPLSRPQTGSLVTISNSSPMGATPSSPPPPPIANIPDSTKHDYEPIKANYVNVTGKVRLYEGLVQET